MIIREFPSDVHYEQQKAKGFDARAGSDLWQWHAYDYGWRRIMLQTRDDISPIDPQKKWFDPALAASAEIYYARKFKRPAPPLMQNALRQTPTPEEIERVECCAGLALSNIKQFGERNRRQFRLHGDPHVADREALRRYHESLGASSTERQQPFAAD
jgi:hypothetical protein